jgi:heptosyltransferase-1
MESYLIIRLSSLGDIIHTLPAYAALRKHRPQAHISWLVEKKGLDILYLVQGIDQIIVVRDPYDKNSFFRKIRNLRKRLARPQLTSIDFQGLIKSGLYGRLSGAKHRIGFRSSNCREKQAAWFYNIKGNPVSEKIHVIRKNLSLLNRLDIREEKFHFPLSIPPELKAAVEVKLSGIKGYTARKKLVIYNVGAAWETKRWFPDRWAEVIEKTGRPSVFPLILWGTPIEKAMAKAIHENTGAPVAPDFSIREVLALISIADLVVSGDTFALQAASAFSVPVVALFGPTNPERNGPFSRLDKVVFHPGECNGCYKRSCGNLNCMDSIRADEVAANILDIIQSWKNRT